MLLLLGFSGTGKSALASAIKRDERCLVDLPLPERIWSGTVVNASNSKCVYNIACANRENKPVLPIVKEGIGNADCMIMDPWNAQNAIVNIVADTIPAIQVWETPRRYDVGLLLNVLHHMGTEEVAVSVFGKVLDVCKHLVVEGPFCESGIEKGHGPSPNALCISDQWVAGVANLYGHKVTEILPSKMQPPYRKVWKMSRASA